MVKSRKETSKKDGNSIKILGIRLDSSGAGGVLAKVIQRIKTGKKTFVVTPNSEFIVFAQAQPWFKTILNQADVAIPDGMGLVWASRFLTRCNLQKGYTLKERLSGTDLMEKLCQEAARHGWSVYLLGGQPGVAKKALAVLKKRYPGLRGWAESGPKKPKDTPGVGECTLPEWRGEKEDWVKKINQKHPDFLFVAFGMGKQEKFIWDNWDQLKVKLAMGVGGAFDYISGDVPRAPAWMRSLGLEWLYRLIRQPFRWRRQLALVSFVWLILKQKVGFKSKEY